MGIKSGWKWFKLLFCFILMNLFLFGLSKTEAGAKTAPRAPKLGYFDRRGPKLSARVTLATLGADVACLNYFKHNNKMLKHVIDV